VRNPMRVLCLAHFLEAFARKLLADLVVGVQVARLLDDPEIARSLSGLRLPAKCGCRTSRPRAMGPSWAADSRLSRRRHAEPPRLARLHPRACEGSLMRNWTFEWNRVPSPRLRAAFLPDTILLPSRSISTSTGKHRWPRDGGNQA
jgi:hypothetical protein